MRGISTKVKYPKNLFSVSQSVRQMMWQVMAQVCPAGTETSPSDSCSLFPVPCKVCPTVEEFFWRRHEASVIFPVSFQLMILLLF